MSIIVQKYGGTSVASDDKIKLVARRVLEAKRAGHDVVVVVSAMGSTTSELLELANNVSNNPPTRELDMLLSAGERISTALLSMALDNEGAGSVSLTGPQCGIYTTDRHFNANIERVDPERVRRELGEGRIVVAAGYQGMSPTGEVTTLGRGGSDTSAVALASALEAERCEIFSDVDGVYSADPRVVKSARRIDEISYSEMVEMARHGASVLNTRAVEMARDRSVELRARSTFKPESPGTIITDLPREEEARIVGVACHKSVVPVVVESVNGDVAALGDKVLEVLGKGDIFMDRTREARRDLLISAEDIADAEAFAEQMRRTFKDGVRVEGKRGSVSAIGLGLGGHGDRQTAARESLEKADVELLDSFHGEHTFTCIVEPKQVSRSMNLLHSELIGSSYEEREVA